MIWLLVSVVLVVVWCVRVGNVVVLVLSVMCCGWVDRLCNISMWLFVLFRC